MDPGRWRAARAIAFAVVLAVAFVAIRDAASVHVTHYATLDDLGNRWNTPPRDPPTPSAALRPVMRFRVSAIAPHAPAWLSGLHRGALIDILPRALPDRGASSCTVAQRLRIQMDCAAWTARTSLDRSRPDDRVNAVVYATASSPPTVVHGVPWSVSDDRPSTRALTALLVATRLAMLAIGVIVIVLGRGIVVWDLFSICVALALAIGSNPTWTSLAWSAFIPRVLVPTALFFAGWRTVILLTRFPLPGIVDLQRRAAAAAPSVFIASAFFFIYFDTIDIWYHTPLSGAAFLAGAAVFFILNVAMVVTLYRAVAGAVDAARDRKRLSWVGVSLVTGLLALGAMWISRVFIDHLRPDPGWLSIALLIPVAATPIGLAYAVLGLNAVNLDRLIRRATAASLLSTGILIAIELGLKVFEKLGAEGGSHHDTESVQQGAVIVSLGAGVLLHRFADPIAALPERLFFRAWRDAKQAMSVLPASLEHVPDVDAFGALCVNTVTALVETSVAVYLRGANGWHRLGPTSPDEPQVVAAADRGVIAATVAAGPFVIAPDDSALAHAYLFSFRSEGSTVGLLVCRGGDTRQPYSAEETDLIASVSCAAGATLATLLRKRRFMILRDHFLAQPATAEREWLLRNGFLDATASPPAL